jgi:hypothetical protein
MKAKLILFMLLFSAASQAQSVSGIYKLKWNIDSRLVNNVVVNNTGNRLSVPTALYDSVISRVEKLVSEEMFTKTQLLYPINRNGKELKTGMSSSQVAGLPRGTKRKAMRTEYMENYVKFKIIVGLTKSASIGNQVVSYSRLRPYVKVKMVAYGLDRRVKRRKQIRLGGFDSVGSFQYQIGGTTVTNTNAMPIEQVLDMVFQGLVKFENKVK